jgi:repressor LexA
MAKGLTEKQRKILEYIIDFQKENGFPPTIRELGDAFAIGSLRGVTVHLDALVRKGYVSRGRMSRSIRLTAPDPRESNGGSGGGSGHGSSGGSGSVRLPVVDALAPDGLLPAPDESSPSVPEALAAAATANGFLFRVGSEGVPGEPILPEDLLVIRPQSTAERGELVAVRSDDHGRLTIRRAAGEKADILVGRVVGLIRRY